MKSAVTINVTTGTWSFVQVNPHAANASSGPGSSTLRSQLTATCQNCVIKATLILGHGECSADFSLSQNGNFMLPCTVGAITANGNIREVKFNCPGCAGTYRVYATIYDCNGMFVGETSVPVTC